MTLAHYLSVAVSVGLSRKDAMLLEISTIFEMVKIREEASKRKDVK